MIEGILAIDIGTSSTKALLVDRDGAVVARWRLPHPTHHPEHGAAEQDSGDWWASVCVVARDTSRHRIAAISVTGQMHGLVARDDLGGAVGHAITWQDQRSAATLPALRSALPVNHPKRTGGDLHPGELAASWHWLASTEPDVAARVASVALPKDDVVRRLTGHHVTDPSDAVGSGLFDVTIGTWDTDVVHAAGIRRSSLPDILPAGSVAGFVTAEAASATGFRAGTPVVLAGGDAAAGAYGAGATRPGADLLMLSTGCQMLLPMSDDVSDPAGAVWPAAGPGTARLRVATTRNGGSAIDWAVATFGVDAPGEREDDRRPWFVPYLAGEREPAVPAHSGSFVGLGVEHGAADLLGAVIDGVTFAIADAAARAGFVIGTDVPLLVGGGGTQREAWVWAVARTFARSLRMVMEPDLSAWGAARVGAVALGWIDPSESPHPWLLRTRVMAPGTEPDAARERLDRWREVAARVTPAMKT